MTTILLIYVIGGGLAAFITLVYLVEDADNLGGAYLGIPLAVGAVWPLVAVMSLAYMASRLVRRQSRSCHNCACGATSQPRARFCRRCGTTLPQSRSSFEDASVSEK